MGTCQKVKKKAYDVTPVFGFASSVSRKLVPGQLTKCWIAVPATFGTHDQLMQEFRLGVNIVRVQYTLKRWKTSSTLQ